MMSKQVNLFILGAQKCGTTSLSDILNSHPEVFIPSIKETYFFCLDKYFEKGASWYEDEFYAPQRATDAKWRGDATPFYLASQTAIGRIADYADDSARFIVILRDPVKRAISAYQHQQRLGYEELDLEAALVAEPDRIEQAKSERGRWWRHAYVDVGHYGAQIEVAQAALGAERLLVMRQDELRDLTAVQEKLSALLGLSGPFSDKGNALANPAAMPRFKLVRNLLTRPNIVKSIAKKLIPREIRTKMGVTLNKLNAQATTRAEISPEIKTALEKRFEADQVKLKALGFSSHTS